ncbi:hypothetical protein QVD17_39189 [Tagetes erecta]|uniref:Uncharacterized protein n=1 Tax=Tagetes erecta TaxID=13708 RepID=A0AAD8JN35_TARER|nr:hypothetical protein QVD17_39189 [Tagetes erecta]
MSCNHENRCTNDFTRGVPYELIFNRLGLEILLARTYCYWLWIIAKGGRPNSTSAHKSKVKDIEKGYSKCSKVARQAHLFVKVPPM